MEYTVGAEVVQIFATKQQLETETFNYILTIYAALGRGVCQRVAQAFPNITPITLASYTLSMTIETLNTG